MMFDHLLRSAALSMVRGYQRFVSPYKGYGCPHRILNGGLSCSEFGADVLERKLPLAETALEMRERFVECREAAQRLRVSAFRCIVIPCCL